MYDIRTRIKTQHNIKGTLILKALYYVLTLLRIRSHMYCTYCTAVVKMTNLHYSRLRMLANANNTSKRDFDSILPYYSTYIRSIRKIAKQHLSR